jgi:GAF domain-containing protein
MRADLAFEEKVDRALELGEIYLDVQNAHLTRIDERIDFWEAIASTDPPDGEFPAGEVLDLKTTYCRRVVEQGATIALSDASEQGWGEDPAFEEHGLRCYHGTPITIENEVWGTLCFVSEEPRETPFSEGETLFA